MARAASVGRLLLLVVWPVAAIEVYTPQTLEVLNGTDVRLKCSFHSQTLPGKQVAVTWNFRPQAGGPDESVFYYHEQPYSPTKGRFSGRVTWDGNINKNDASIMLWHVNLADNGTFQCLVKNPPDVDGNIGEIQLAVVLRVAFSEIHILAITIGSACVLMIVIVVVVVICRQQRRKRQEKNMEMVETERPEKEKLWKAQPEDGAHTPAESPKLPPPLPSVLEPGAGSLDC
ncbi:myelin protein zero-like protein 2 [Eublepharis macularius]|uniref:Myelin protein zero-like protein 2 n=1 Tax=Eublepharis macularius TaxID=481883 RepID=A0AA97LGI2_EUBMA|nr:myelin protein zero-like protein 2 [Eublepharis macularius]